MRRIFASFAAATLLAVIAATSALAVSPSQRECEAAGGTFTKEKGTVQCVIVTEESVANENANPNNNAQTTETETTESSQGTLKNKPHHEESVTCDGPGGSGDNSAHCAN